MAAESAARRRQPSRLQCRAPASIQINRSPQWNAAIPLLSPVVSPQASFGEAPEADSRKDGRQGAAGSDQKPAVAFKKWQAAPFCYEPAPLPAFVGLDASRR